VIEPQQQLVDAQFDLVLKGEDFTHAPLDVLG
jgi:hypothetical protein